MKSHWLTHQGKQIWFSDYANFGWDNPALFAEVNASDEYVCQQPLNSVLVLTDMRHTNGGPAAVSFLKQSSARTQKYIRRMAILGVTGPRKVLYEAIIRFSGQKNTALFDDEAQAQDWLTAEQ